MSFFHLEESGTELKIPDFGTQNLILSLEGLSTFADKLSGGTTMSFAGFLFSLANVQCEQCQKKLKLENIKHNAVLECDSCGHSKPIEKRGQFPHIEFDKNLVRPADSVNIERRGSILIIEKKWFSKKSKILLGLAALWNLPLLMMMAAPWSGLFPADSFHFEITEKALMGGIGLGLGLWALRHSLNRTRIMIKNSKMVVSTSPLDWKNLEIYDIGQIANVKLWDNRKSGGPAFSFRVDLTMKDGTTVTLCPAEDCNEAVYIEKTLEEFLAIEQTPVVVDPLVS